MKIFLSWSGSHSRAIAEALNDWLRRVIQAVKPFYSPDIEKGAKWSGEIDNALEGTSFGIICLTPDNLASTWIHFEAGALSKTKEALIWTFLHGLKPGDVPQPLGKFQHTLAEKADTLKLLRTINKRLGEVGGESLTDKLLEENFELLWPQLEESLRTAGKLSKATAIDSKAKRAGERDERAILDEMLELLRNQERRISNFEARLASPPGKAKRQGGTATLFKSLEIPVYSEQAENAETIAGNIAEFLEVYMPGSDVLKVKTITGPVITVDFSLPISEKRLNSLLDKIEIHTGFSVERWKATHA
jgi:hypothetical protein